MLSGAKWGQTRLVPSVPTSKAWVAVGHGLLATSMRLSVHCTRSADLDCWRIIAHTHGDLQNAITSLLVCFGRFGVRSTLFGPSGLSEGNFWESCPRSGLCGSLEEKPLLSRAKPGWTGPQVMIGCRRRGPSWRAKEQCSLGAIEVRVELDPLSSVARDRGFRRKVGTESAAGARRGTSNSLSSQPHPMFRRSARTRLTPFRSFRSA